MLKLNEMSFNFMCLNSNPAITYNELLMFFVSPVISVALKVGIEYTVYTNRSLTKKISILSAARQPKSGLGRLTVDVHRSHTHKQTHTRLDSSERVIG
jgi:hypothetical protein